MRNTRHSRCLTVYACYEQDDGSGDWQDPNNPAQCPQPSYFFTGLIAFMWWCWCAANYYYENYKHADFRKKLKIIKKSAVSAEIFEKLVCLVLSFPL